MIILHLCAFILYFSLEIPGGNQITTLSKHLLSFLLLMCVWTGWRYHCFSFTYTPRNGRDVITVCDPTQWTLVYNGEKLLIVTDVSTQHQPLDLVLMQMLYTVVLIATVIIDCTDLRVHQAWNPIICFSRELQEKIKEKQWKEEYSTWPRVIIAALSLSALLAALVCPSQRSVMRSAVGRQDT